MTATDKREAAAAPLLELRAVSREFRSDQGAALRAGAPVISILKAVDLQVGAGETVGLVGESGSGKTSLARLVLRLDRPSSGQILFQGQDMAAFDRAGLRHYRRHVQPVFQDPYSSLNPRLTVGHIIAEPLIVSSDLGREARRARVAEVLQAVGLPQEAASRYPHEFSGGQRQRIAIARALTLEPSLMILDEPVSALDISIRAQVMNILDDLRQRLGISYLLISHDLDLVLKVSDRIDVMYLGTIVESAPRASMAQSRRHPYTQALFASRLPSHPRDRREVAPLEGELASPLTRPRGCPFHPRCKLAVDRCRIEAPVLRADWTGHATACHLVDPA